MDLLAHLALGFGQVLTLDTLAALALGCVLGIVVGVLPGMGPLAAIALVLPLALTMSPITALVLMSGIYYGALFGGATGAVLLRRPGGPASAATCLDGHEMARVGRTGTALTAATLASFAAGVLGTAVLAMTALPLAQLAFLMGPAEYVCLMLLGLLGVVVLSPGSLLKSLGLAVLGLLLGLAGSHGQGGLLTGLLPGAVSGPGGISLVLLALGVFVVADTITRLDHGEPRPPGAAPGADRRAVPRQGRRLPARWTRPDPRELRTGVPAAARGTLLGSVLGIVPGGGALLASFASYALEKRVARHPERFGKGAIEGVAGPEAANNAGAQTSFLPLLVFGVPPNAVLALLIGAMLLLGVSPGPQVMVQNPALFWGLVSSMWVGNLLLLLLHLPLLRLWVRMLMLPHALIVPVLVLLCGVGAFAWNGGGAVAVYQVALFAIAGYLLHKLHADPAPLLLGFVLAPMLADNLQRAMSFSQGDWSVFVSRPGSLALLLVAGAMVPIAMLPAVRARTAAVD